MKNLLKAFACAFAISTCYNCTVEPTDSIHQEELVITQSSSAATFDNDVPGECSDQDPQAMLINNSLLVADFEVFDHFGILMTHSYGVPAGEASNLLSFPDGVTSFVVSTSATVKTININMGNCMIYEVAIDENNQLDTDQPIQL